MRFLVEVNYGRLWDAHYATSKRVVAVVEEYMAPENVKYLASVDGFICNGELYRYAISDNVYSMGSENFESLVSPTQRLTDAEQIRCWELYEEVVGSLLSAGLDNSFVDVEFFILKEWATSI